MKYSDGVYADYVTYAQFPNSVKNFLFGGLSRDKRTTVNIDFFVNQKLEFVTKGLSANAKLSFDNNISSSGPSISSTNIIEKFILPDIVNEIKPGMTAEDIRLIENKYTVWKVPSGTSGFDFVQPPNSYGAESVATNVYRNIYYEFSLNYARDFEKHSLTGLALMSRQISASGSVFPSYREDWVGRVTYGYDKRYLLELNGAYNGSEKFAPKYRFGFFPSMALGWVVSNEAFFESFKGVINNLKLRYSDGVIGSDAGIDRWLYLGSWVVQPPSTSSTSTNYVRFGINSLKNNWPLRYEGTVPNPDIHWEVSHKTDYGIETGFFMDQLKVNFDYFTEERSNVFIAGTARIVPEYLGTSPVAANLGKVNTHGWELDIQLSKTWPRGLNIWVSHSWTYANSKVIDRADPPLKPAYQKLAGFPIDQPRTIQNQSLYGCMNTWNDIYNSVGPLSNSVSLPGDIALLDYNSDGVVDTNDQLPVGYTKVPQYTYAPAAGFNYKKWSGNVKFYGVYNDQGTNTDNRLYRESFANQFDIVYPWDLNQSWSPERNNTTTAIRRGLRFLTAQWAGDLSNPLAGFVYYPRYYLRLQHAEIAYTVASERLNKIGITNLKFTLSGENLVLWSPMYEDLDSNPTAPSGDIRNTYPKFKRYSFGINFNFQ